MLVLIGTKEGFKISEQWILDRTGLQHSSYINARKALVKRGWISLDAAKSIVVNYDSIYAENRSNTTLPQNNSSNTTLLQRGNTILPQRGNTTLPITNNNTDNITDNIADCAKAQSGGLDANASIPLNCPTSSKGFKF